MTIMLERGARQGGRAQPGPLPRLLAGGRKLGEHRATYGQIPLRRFASEDGRRKLVRAVTDAGLRGRGGAGFPTGLKMASVAAGAKRPVVIANGCESEPASRKDKMLMVCAPHLVLDGAVLAAHAVGADRVYVCVERGTSVADRLEREIAHRDDPVKWKLVRVPRRYVSSEESALVHLINDGDGRPMAAPPRPYEKGVGGRPTLVDNVETLAHVALIAAYGPEWFREVGTRSDPGSTLVTIGGAVARPNVYEIAPGMRLGEVLDAAGGAVEPIGAVLVGGYFGTWVPMPDGWGLPLTHDRTGPLGTSLGSGGIVALPAESCGLAETARIVRYLAEESAQQCGPCMFGLPAIATDLAAVAYGRCDPATRQRLTRRMAQVKGRGACRHPDGATKLATSALATFADDLETHMDGWTCTGVSRDPVLPLPDRRHRDRSWK
ncbi:NADH-ubiquinone oxidoreductase-F iron-sulfur binding region domain-containing protein [Phytohabitans flavus]|uniref:NADH dehydrogenase n=1 Tax=Phytohabitans flavus TaxID=1076124 RepID=A0A6F8XTX5_9ACTN|nr:NADH-ubiquinone oxidoreductase-F iron-sulfur binding region domain-containing protein [Phytohabitans flavus]BCB77283.1 NADH dehydrogenase [Phytohabitans flavus]